MISCNKSDKSANKVDFDKYSTFSGNLGKSMVSIRDQKQTEQVMRTSMKPNSNSFVGRDVIVELT